MPSPNRRSIAQAPDAPTDDADGEDVAAILNEEAANTTPRSTRKRRRTGEASDAPTSSPSKRAEVNLPSASTPEAPVQAAPASSRRQSARLQKRTSLAPPAPVNKRDLFAHPDEPDTAPAPAPAPAPTASLPPPKKVRSLNKQSKRTVSPFKGRGIMETRSDARVNLDSPLKQSPQKRRVIRTIQKVGKSMQERSRPMTGRDEPFGGEDIFAAAQEQPADEPITPGIGQRPTEIALPPPSPDRSTKGKSPRKKPQRVRAAGPRQTEADSGREAAARVPNPLAEAAEYANIAHAVPEPSVDDPPAQEEPEGDTEVAGADETEQATEGAVDSDRAATTPPPRRPQTSAEEQNYAQQVSEAEAKHQEMIDNALQGIEGAAALHDCKDAWQDILVAAAEMIDDRSSSDPVSAQGKGTVRYLKKMRKTYKTLARTGIQSPSQQVQMADDLKVLKSRCVDICSNWAQSSDFQDRKRDRERKRMGEDIYEHLIPGSLLVAKSALKARFRDGDLDLSALREICRLLAMTQLLTRSAAKWKPRPTLAVKGKTKSEIAPNVHFIRNAYLNVLAERDRARYRDDLAAEALANVETLDLKFKQKKDAIREKHRASRHPDTNAGVFDIDTITMDERHPSLLRGPENVQLPLRRARPQPVRESTEEIPAPVLPDWDESELVVLTLGLRRYRSATRFQDIVRKYGGLGGELEKYNKDDIMARASWLKEIMAGELEDLSNREWDWLRSVPAWRKEASIPVNLVSDDEVVWTLSDSGVSPAL